MNEQTMSYQQFMRGLAGGIRIIAAAGAFWLSFGLWHAGRELFFGAFLIIVPCTIVLMAGANRVQKKAHGFRFADLKHANLPQRKEAEKIKNFFAVTGAAQTVLIGLSAFVTWRFGHAQLLWPLIGLIVSHHFAPLAWIFRVQPYYAVALLGSIVSLISLFSLQGSMQNLVLGLGIGVAFWLCAIYLILNTDQVAGSAVGKS
jgi:hypothetical protein